MTPYYDREGITLHLGDCREGMAELAENSVDAIVTDPPYGLEFMGKEWDKLERIGFHRGPPKMFQKGGSVPLPPTPRLDQSRGKRCQRCKKYAGGNPKINCMCEMPQFVNISRGPEQEAWHYAWAVAALRVLKPGGHLLAFGGTRTHHRLWCALEDAGFEIRDTLSWLYGSGFPKSLDVSKAIDKAAGAEREVVARNPNARNSQRTAEGHVFWDGADLQANVTAAATDAARQWEGWGSALKPAWEPIVLARKPLSEPNIAANVLRWGTGGINIGACRVGAEQRVNSGMSSLGVMHDDDWQPHDVSSQVSGRFPANLVLECTCEETREALVKTHWGESRERDTSEGTLQCKRMKRDGTPIGYADPDGKEAVTVHTDPNCPCYLLDAQSGELHTHPGKMRGTSTAIFGNATREPGEILSRASSGGASRFFYCAKASSAERNGSKHPTIKPLALMRYLCRLVTPPNGIILDPFAGSGTTLEAARLEGFRAIGIEMNEEYCADAERRLGKWLL
jgi:site-specific DNA-methyltransferase (adenine-specific)